VSCHGRRRLPQHLPDVQGFNILSVLDRADAKALAEGRSPVATAKRFRVS
jgi:hypothetical protein